jgi:hypothetical protein
VQADPRLSGPITCYWIQLLLVQFGLEGVLHKAGSRQLVGSLLQQRISPDIDSSVKVSVHERHTFLAVTGCTRSCQGSSNFRPPSHLLFC